MKRKKIIKKLREAKTWLDQAASQNMKMVVPDCPLDEKAAFESGIIAMNASAQSMIDALIREVKLERREYGGFVLVNDSLKMK